MGVRNKTKLNLSSLFVYVVRLDDSSGTGEKNGIKKKNGETVGNWSFHIVGECIKWYNHLETGCFL